MVIQVHGFDWDIYAEQVMPAFGQCFLENDERTLLALFEKTRCSYEEQFLPDPMQRLRVWPRAYTFIQTLPRGPYSRREYQKLCLAAHYTAMSDRYLFRHPPQLYQHSNALRSVWGAIVEAFCLPWSNTSPPTERADLIFSTADVDLPLRLVASGEPVSRGELAFLLTEAGLPDLAQEVEAQDTPIDYQTDASDGEIAEEFTPVPPDESDSETVIAAQGVLIGDTANLLRLRGWLANTSIRALALFEFLVCGRRTMPFGFEPGEPFGAFAGYLTPDEVWQLSASLEGVVPPEQAAAEEDYLNFRYQHYGIPPDFRLIDEVLPSYVADFLSAVRKAAAQRLGLISSME